MEEKENFDNKESDLDNEEQKADPGKRIFRGALALLAIAGLLYLSGIYQSFFYRITPAGVEQRQIQSAVDAEAKTAPLTVFILEVNGTAASYRNEEDIRRLVENAGRIWEQAGVKLEIKNMYVLERSKEELAIFYSDPAEFIQGIDEIDPKAVNLLLTENLGGINGIAFGGLRTVAVADYTTGFDFRTLAHEIGHVLGLDHVRDGRRLMSSGGSGSELSPEEIMTARERAEGLFGGL